MVFSSTIFLFVFLPVVWLVNRLLPHKGSNAFLCAASLLFYAWGEPIYVVLMIVAVLLNYACSYHMAEMTDKAKKRMLIIGVILNLLMLGVFKYTDFLIGTLNTVLGTSLPMPHLGLPIGISFFTFQSMSYTIDVYRGITKPQKQLHKLMLYVSFFPQLIAGPIVIYHDIEEQIEQRQIKREELVLGIRRFITGLSKKVLIANTLSVLVDKAYAANAYQLSTGTVWLAAIAYALQLYFDFSGYSDMAIGMGHMFGFTFLENFNYPYSALSLRDFWRRWHISLSTWFREYLYIPLGGNRKGNFRAGINRMIVFFLTGLWHGAQWTFVAWGLWHGLFLMLESYGIIRFNRKFALLGSLYTLLVVVLGFVLFRAASFPQAIAMLSRMFGIGGLGGGISMIRWLTPSFVLALIAAVFGCTPLFHSRAQRIKLKRENTYQFVTQMGSLLLLVLCMLSLASLTHNPFIYFRF